LGIKIRIGSRGSKLAIWQANYAKRALENLGHWVDIVPYTTRGDVNQHLSLVKIEGKGFFTKALELGLLNDEIDLAVHSMKDMPTEKNPALIIAGVSERANPSDWLIFNKSCFDANQVFKLKKKARIGTSSLRRKVQIQFMRPDAKVINLRGNVPTRITKLSEGAFDGIILAAAGIERLQIDLSEYHVVRFSPKEFIPAPAQGVLAYQIAQKNEALGVIIKQIHHQEVSKVTNVERKVMQLLGGGCNTPVGAYCYRDNAGNYHAWGSYAEDDEAPLVKSQISYNTRVGLAEALAENLLKR
jgi:hydroxymethylbilane synthase